MQIAKEVCSCGAMIEIEAYGVDSVLQNWRENHLHEMVKLPDLFGVTISPVDEDGSIDLSKTPEFAIEEARRSNEA